MVEAVLLGVALAAVAGLRLFLPFLFVGGMARFAHVSPPELLEWTATGPGLLLLGIATVVEILGDKIPVVDHALDVVATFLKPIAGFVLPAALLYDLSPAAAWALGIVAGAPLAFGVHATKAGTRAASSATTLGAGNPVLSFLEDALAVVMLIFTLLAPVAAALLAVGLFVLAIRAWRRMRRRPAAPASTGAEPGG